MFQSPTALKWPYPLLRPSPRFNYFNDFVRQLDVRYTTLAPDEQDEWELAAQTWLWWAKCLPWIFDFDPLDQAPGTGLAAFRGVNCARLTLGMSVIQTPPDVVTVPGADLLLLTDTAPPTVVWTRGSEDPPGDHTLTVYAAALNHEPERGPAVQKYKYAGSVAIAIGESVSLYDILAALGWTSGPSYIALALGLSSSGQPPFFGARLGFQGPLEA